MSLLQDAFGPSIAARLLAHEPHFTEMRQRIFDENEDPEPVTIDLFTRYMHMEGDEQRDFVLAALAHLTAVSFAANFVFKQMDADDDAHQNGKGNGNGNGNTGTEENDADHRTH